MKTRYAILFTIGALFATAPATAVPPKPINATAVTLLPADGTPDALRKMVAAFSKNVSKANSDAETKRAQLDKQMEEGIDRAISKAQSSGDINTVLALKAAKDKFATLTTSEVPLVRNVLEFREKKTAEIETARIADAMKAAKELNDELEKEKKEETIKGNFDSAKAMADHQEKVVAWVQTLRSSAPQPLAQQKQTSARPTTEQQPVRTQAEPPRTIIVNSRSANGASIGMAKAGDTFRIQYVSGRWNCAFISENPDDPEVKHVSNRCCLVLLNNPARSLATIPSLTKQRPFSFVVPEDGEYALRAFEGGGAVYRRSHFDDNTGAVQYSIQLVHGSPTSTVGTSSTPNASWVPDNRLGEPETVARTPPTALQQPRAISYQNAEVDSHDTGNRQTTMVGVTSVTTKILTVDARREKGSLIGSLKKGDILVIRYLSGAWSSARSVTKRSPDSGDWGPWGGMCQAVLAMGDGSKARGIPAHTAENPFEFVVDEDGLYAIRIRDRGVHDNDGSVRYEVQVFPAGTR